MTSMTHRHHCHYRQLIAALLNRHKSETNKIHTVSIDIDNSENINLIFRRRARHAAKQLFSW